MLDFFRKRMKGIMIAVAVIFAVSMLYGLRMSNWQGGGYGGSSKSIGKVNGREIDPLRYREMVNRLVQQLGGRVPPQQLAFIQNLALGQTVDFMLILNEAQKRVRVSGREVDMAIESIMKQQNIPSRQALEAALKKAGLKTSDFKNLIKQEMLVQKMVTKIREEVKVTPNDLREVRASHILVSKEATAKLLQAQLKQSGDFAALAKKYSLDPGSAARGGDLGYFTTGMMVGPFEQAAFSLKIGEISPIVKTDYGYHLIKVTDSRLRKFPGDPKNVQQTALMEKQEKAFRQWFGELKAKAKVEITSSELKALDLRAKGRVWEAIEEYKKAIRQNSQNPYLHVYLADSYASVGKKDLAVSEYEAAIAVQGGSPDLYVILGQAYESWGQKEQALQQYRRASLVAGENQAYHEQLLQIFQKAGAAKDAANERREISKIEAKAKALGGSSPR